MRVLLAGATGAIGARLVPQLLAAGHEVTQLSRHPGSAVNVIRADILNREELLDAVDGQQFDAVIHHATALKTPPTLFSHMWRTNRLRTEGTSALLAAADLVGAERFITASVFYGYGFDDHGSKLLTEDAPFGLRAGSEIDAVQRAVLSNEQQVRAFGGVSLRFGLVYGDGYSRVAAKDWDGLLPLVHLEDAASATVKALTKGRAGSAYNIADERPTSWRELQEAQAVAAGVGFPRLLRSSAIRVAAPFGGHLLTATSMQLSMAKARRELGWAPRYRSFAEGLATGMTITAGA